MAAVTWCSLLFLLLLGVACASAGAPLNGVRAASISAASGNGDAAGRLSGEIIIVGRLYYYSTDNFWTWAEAKAACEARNMQLLSLETEAETFNLSQYFSNFISLMYQPFWTSGYRAAGSSEWVWSASGETVSYFFWETGYPSSSLAEEVCLVFTSYGWMDLGCGFLQYLFCEQL